MPEPSTTADTLLADLTVLDFTHHIAGPYATKHFADYGANVIKVERPTSGDGARRLGPFAGDQPHLEKSGLFLYLNTNKRSLTLDLTTPQGRDIALGLARTADLVVENFRPGVVERLGLGYATLAAANPALVMVSLSNFGQTGPYRDDRGTEMTLYAMGGEMYALGQPDRSPVNQYPFATLVQAGAAAALAAMGGLAKSAVSGVGTWADVSIMEAQAASQDRRVATLVAYQFSGLVSGRVLSWGMGYPVGVYPCADGYIEITGAYQWDRVVRMLGNPDQFADPKWRAPTAAMDPALQAEFEAFFYPWLLERTKLDIWKAAQAAHVLCGPLYTMEDVADDPVLTSRGLWAEVDHPAMGRVKLPGRPFITDPPWSLRRPAPLLGQHTDEILGEIGYTAEDIAGLRAEGVV